MSPIRRGDGVTILPTGLAEVRKGDGTKIWPAAKAGGTAVYAQTGATSDKQSVMPTSGPTSAPSIQWSVPVSDQGATSNGSPVMTRVTDTSIYVMTYTNNRRLYAIDREKGELLWTVDLGTDVLMKMVYYEPEEYVICDNNGALTAIDKYGKAAWTTTEESLGWQVDLTLGDDGYVYALSGNMFKLDPTDGSIVWSVNQTTPARLSSIPLTGDESGIFDGRNDGALSRLDTSDGSGVFTEFSGTVGDSRMVWAGNGYVYLVGEHGDNDYGWNVVQMDAGNGTQGWTHQFNTQDYNYPETQPLITPNYVVIQLGGVDCTVYAHDKGSGGVQWSSSASNQMHDLPMDQNNNIYCNGGGTYDVKAINESDGSVVWSTSVDNGLGWAVGQVIPDNGEVIVTQQAAENPFGPDERAYVKLLA